VGIDDESSHPRLCSEVADGVTRPMGVRLFREPDAVTPPVRFDEREQETEPSQTGLRRAKRKLSPSATGRLKPLRLFSTLPNYARCGPAGRASECHDDFSTVIGMRKGGSRHSSFLQASGALERRLYVRSSQIP